MTERQCGRRHDVGRWGGFTLTGQDIENDIGGMDAVTERFGTSRFHRGQTVSQHRVEDVDHLPIAIVGAGKLAPDPLDRGRQHPVFEGSTVAQGAGFAGEHRHIMPGVVDGIAAAKGSWVLGNDASILTDYDAIGIGLNLDRSSDCAGCDRTRQVFETDAVTAWKPSKRPA